MHAQLHLEATMQVCQKACSPLAHVASLPQDTRPHTEAQMKSCHQSHTCALSHMQCEKQHEHTWFEMPRWNDRDQMQTCTSVKTRVRRTWKRASTALKACLSATSPTTSVLLTKVRELQTATACFRDAGHRMVICYRGPNLRCSTGTIPCISSCKWQTIS